MNLIPLLVCKEEKEGQKTGFGPPSFYIRRS